jgi:hypothetical protein
MIDISFRQFEINTNNFVLDLSTPVSMLEANVSVGWIYKLERSHVK